MNGADGVDQPDATPPGGASGPNRGDDQGNRHLPSRPPGSDPHQWRPEANGLARTPRPGGAGLLQSEIASGLAWSLVSFVIIYWITQLFDFGGATWPFICIWILSGLIILWPGSEGLVARYLFGLRQPTMVERQRLLPSWYAVASRAGVDANRYTLWIQNAEGATAAAAGGRTVSVTGWAMYTLPPSHLEAVLAFDFTSHLHGPSWLSRLAVWYSVPTRGMALGIRKLVKLSQTIPAIGCTIVGFFLVAYIGLFLVALVFYDGWTIPLLYVSPIILPLIFLGLAHWTQRMADRATADLGYGRKLLEVFYGWQTQHQEVSRKLGLTQPDWLGGQPTVAERIRALENYLHRR